LYDPEGFNHLIPGVYCTSSGYLNDYLKSIPLRQRITQ